MKSKVTIYNIVKGTNCSFKSYLGKIGIILKEVYDKTLGILTSIDGIVSIDDTYDLFAWKNPEFYLLFAWKSLYYGKKYAWNNLEMGLFICLKGRLRQNLFSGKKA